MWLRKLYGRDKRQKKCTWLNQSIVSQILNLELIPKLGSDFERLCHFRHVLKCKKIWQDHSCCNIFILFSKFLYIIFFHLLFFVVVLDHIMPNAYACSELSDNTWHAQGAIWIAKNLTMFGCAQGNNPTHCSISLVLYYFKAIEICFCLIKHLN